MRNNFSLLGSTGDLVLVNTEYYFFLTLVPAMWKFTRPLSCLLPVLLMSDRPTSISSMPDPQMHWTLCVSCTYIHSCCITKLNTSLQASLAKMELPPRLSSKDCNNPQANRRKKAIMYIKMYSVMKRNHAMSLGRLN